MSEQRVDDFGPAEPVQHAAEDFGPPEPVPENMGVVPMPGAGEQAAELDTPEADDARIRAVAGLGAAGSVSDPAAVAHARQIAADAALATAKAKASSLTPDAAAEALDRAQSTGLGPIYVQKNLDAVRKSEEDATFKATVATAPVLASWAAQSPAHAIIAKEHAEPLSFLEWFFGKYDHIPVTQHPAPWATAGIDYPIPTTTTGEKVIPGAWESFLAKGLYALRGTAISVKQGLRPRFGPGGEQIQTPAADLAADETSRTEAQEYAAAEVPGTEGHLGREVIGASIEAVPQLAALYFGGMPFLAAQSYGDLRAHFVDQKKEDGTPRFTEEQARGLALGGSTALTVMFGGLGKQLAGDTIGKLLSSEARDGLQRSAADAMVEWLTHSSNPLVANIEGRALQLSQAAAHGIGFMVGQAVITDLTSQAGEVMTGGKYDASKTVQAAKRAVQGAAMISPLISLGPTAGLLGDVGRVWKAHETAVDVASAIAAAKDTKILKTAPEQAQPLLDAQARTAPGRSTAFIPVAAFDEAMRGAGHEPSDVAAALADQGAAYQEAKATGGDLALPMSEVLGKLAPAGLADALVPDIKFDPGPDGMSLREAQQIDMSKMREALSVAAARELYSKMPADEQQALLLPIAADLTPEQAKMLRGQLGTDATTPERGRTPERNITPNQAAAMMFGEGDQGGAAPPAGSEGGPAGGGGGEGGAFRIASPEEFEAAKANMAAEHPQYAKHLAPKTAEDYQHLEAHLREDGLVGYAVSDDGDLVNVFNNNGDGAGAAGVIEAVATRGARTLDCYDKFLPGYYSGYGFKETGRMPFDEGKAPAGWNPDTDGRPDVVFMAYQDGDPATIAERVGTFPLPAKSEVVESDWEEAKLRSRQSTSHPRGDGGGPQGGQGSPGGAAGLHPEPGGRPEDGRGGPGGEGAAPAGQAAPGGRREGDRARAVGVGQSQSPGLARAQARAKEARDLDSALAAYAAQRIASLPLGQIRPATYEQQARTHALRMQELAREVETGRAGASETRVITPQNPKGEAAHYRLVEAADLVPSHMPETFSPNPAYPNGVQERDYRTVQVEQGKVSKGGRDLNPALVLADTPTAVDGPPLVTSGGRAYVLGGNGRSMMLLRAYRDGGAAAEAYKDALRKKATAFGIDQAAVDQMKQPVLVRSIDTITSAAPPLEMRAAVRRFNEGMTQELSPRLKAVAEARVLTPQTIASIGDLLGEGDKSVRELLRERPQDFLRILERDGVVNDQNRARFTAGGELTEQAKDEIEGMFLGRVMGSPERLGATSPSLQAKVERAVPSLLRVAGINPGFDEIGDVQGGIDLINDAMRRGLPLEDVLNQRTMFVTGRVEPRTVAMARLLEEKSGKDIGARFKAWADTAAYDPKQTGMFEQPKSAEDALQRLFAGQKDDVSGPSRAADAPPQPTVEESKYAPPAAPFLTEQAKNAGKKAEQAQELLSEVQTQHRVADHLAKAAEVAKAEAGRVKASLTDSAAEEKRAPLLRADQEIGEPGTYADAHDAILEALGFRQPSGRPISIEPAIARISADDKLNFDPDALRAILAKPAVRQMRLGAALKGSIDCLTLDEAKVVQAALKNIRHAANAAIEVVRDEQKAQYVDDVRQMADFMASRPRQPPPAPSGAGGGGAEGGRFTLAKGNAVLLQPRNILHELGPVGEAYFHDYLRSLNRGEELKKVIGGRIQKAIDAMPRELKASRFDGVDGPPVRVDSNGMPVLHPDKWVRQDLWMLWAWMGTASSAERAAKGLGISEEQIHATLDQLSKGEKDFIQSSVWDVNDQVLKPELLKQTAKNTGVPMETIEARPITTKDGEYRGGFHHASYNRLASQKAAARGIVKMDGVGDYYGDLKSGWAVGPAKGFTKSRVEGAFDVPNLNWNSYGSHINGVVHYLAVDDFVKAFGGLLQRPDFRALVANKLGPEKLDALDRFLRTAATGRADLGGMNEIDRFLGSVFRSRAATSAFSLNVPVVAMQLSHLPFAAFVNKLRPDDMLHGVASAFNPLKWKAAHEASAADGYGELGRRWNNYGDKMRAMLAGVGPEGEQTGRLLRAVTGGDQPGRVGMAVRDANAKLNHWLDAASWSLYHTMDGFLSLTIWHAAERKALREGASEQEAAKAAEDAVGAVMPPMTLAENSAFARDRGLTGSLILVRRFPNVVYNGLAKLSWEARNEVWQSNTTGISRLKKAGWETAVAAGLGIGATLSVHLIGRYLGGHGRKEQEGETWPQFLIRQGLIGLAYPLPFGEEVATPLVERALLHKQITGDVVHNAFRAPPTIAIMEDEIRDLGKAWDERRPLEDRLFAGSEVLMRLRGIPVAPVKQVKSLVQMGTRRYRARGPADAADKLIYGPPRPKRESNPLSDLSRLRGE